MVTRPPGYNGLKEFTINFLFTKLKLMAIPNVYILKYLYIHSYHQEPCQNVKQMLQIYVQKIKFTNLYTYMMQIV